MCGRYVQKNIKDLADAFDARLRADLSTPVLHGLMPAPANGALSLRPVTPRVNMVRHDDANLLAPYIPDVAPATASMGNLL